MIGAAGVQDKEAQGSRGPSGAAPSVSQKATAVKSQAKGCGGNGVPGLCSARPVRQHSGSATAGKGRGRGAAASSPVPGSAASACQPPSGASRHVGQLDVVSIPISCGRRALSVDGTGLPLHGTASGREARKFLGRWQTALPRRSDPNRDSLAPAPSRVPESRHYGGRTGHTGFRTRHRGKGRLVTWASDDLGGHRSRPKGVQGRAQDTMPRPESAPEEEEPTARQDHQEEERGLGVVSSPHGGQAWLRVRSTPPLEVWRGLQRYPEATGGLSSWLCHLPAV